MRIGKGLFIPLASLMIASTGGCELIAGVDRSQLGEFDGQDASPDSPDSLPSPTECAVPVFDPPAGTIAAGTNVSISSASANQTGAIFYTTNGSAPTFTDLLYTGPIQVKNDVTIKAVAYVPGSCLQSAVASASYVVTHASDGGSGPGIPMFTPSGGSTFTNDVHVLISSSGATSVCYTLDGTAPSCNANGSCAVGALYDSESGGIALPPSGSTSTTGSYNVSAIGCAPGEHSAVEVQNYTMVVAPITSSAAAGSHLWSSNLTTTLSSTTSGATIRYAWNGTPTCGSNIASGPIALQSGSLKAIACKGGYASLPVSEFVHTVSLNPPAISAAPGSPVNTPAFSATLSNAANSGSGGWVCYTTGASSSIAAPQCGSSSGGCANGNLLPLSNDAGAISIGASGDMVKAIACAPAGLTSSSVATSGPYTLQLSAPYVLANGATPPGQSQYTIGGSTSVVIGQTGTDSSPATQKAEYACYIQNPTGGQQAACNGTTCASGSTKITLMTDGNYWDTGAGGFGSFAPADSLSVVLCPPSSGAGSGYAASEPLTVQFVAGASDAGSGDGGADGGADATLDASVDASADAGVDATADASADATADASSDATADASADAGSDASDSSTGDADQDAAGDAAVADANDSSADASDSGGACTTLFGAAGTQIGLRTDNTGVVLTRLNGDSHLDAVISARLSNRISVLLGNGDGTFGARVDYPTSVNPLSVAVGDLNGDNKNDVITLSSPGFGSAGAVSVLMGNGDGTLQARVDYATGNGTTAVATGDFNGDNKLDVIAANAGADTVSILLGNGDGTLQAKSDFATGSTPAAIVVADVDNDGKLDAVVINAGANTVSVLLGTANGTLQAHVDYATDTGVNAVAVGDVNGDSKLDIATSNAFGPENPSVVSILLGNGNGTFQAKTSVATGRFPYSVQLSDLDNDGHLDVVCACAGDDTISVNRGNGDGTFKSVESYSTGSGTAPSVVAVGDLNGGRPDIFVNLSITDTATVLLNQCP